jgi:hypothetical protein
MANLPKKVIDALSDNRFPPVTFVHDLHRESLDTQETFVYVFVQYAAFMSNEYRNNRLHPDFINLGQWCDNFIRRRWPKE